MKRLLSIAFSVLLATAAFAGDPPQDTVKKEKAKAKSKSSKGNDSKGNEAGMIISEKGQPTERPKGTKATKTTTPSTDTKTETPK